jgi:hypothetical protein
MDVLIRWQALTLKEPPPIPVNHAYMRSMVHGDAYRALNRRFGMRLSDGRPIGSPEVTVKRSFRPDESSSKAAAKLGRKANEQRRRKQRSQSHG